MAISDERRKQNREAQARWRARNPDKEKAKNRAKLLKSRYGLTVDDWEKLFNHQGRRCAACFDPQPAGGWATDHDHETGTTRGILCNHCNLALGHANDCHIRLSRLARYVKYWDMHKAEDQLAQDT